MVRQNSPDQFRCNPLTHRQSGQSDRISKIAPQKLRDSGIFHRRTLKTRLIKGISEHSDTVPLTVESFPVNIADEAGFAALRRQPLVRIIVAQRQPGLRPRSKEPIWLVYAVLN